MPRVAILLITCHLLLLTALRADTPQPVTLWMIGDSTMATHNPLPPSPTRGWGQMFQPYFKDSLHVENHAMSGRSSKNFITEGRWKMVIERMKAGDFLIVQFGHNDEKTDEKRHTEPFGEFTQNLARFASEAREKGATPILVTPVARSFWEKRRHVP